MAKALVLTSISGTKVGVRYTLSGRTSTIGSDVGCDMTIADRAVTAKHAEVKQLLDSWFVVPLGGGVFINGTAVSGQARLRPGDSLIVGSSGFTIAIEDVAERTVGQHAPRGGTQRLGEQLIAQGLLTRSQLEQATRRQEDLTSQGRRVPLGDLLVQLGYLNQATLDGVLRTHQRDIDWRD